MRLLTPEEREKLKAQPKSAPYTSIVVASLTTGQSVMQTTGTPPPPPELPAHLKPVQTAVNERKVEAPRAVETFVNKREPVKERLVIQADPEKASNPS